MPTTQASAPNTSKFRASVGGMVEIVKNYRSPGGQYDFPRNYVIGIKVGGGVDQNVHNSIKREINDMREDLIRRLSEYDEAGANFTVYGVAINV